MEYDVKGMSCAACVAHVEKAVKDLPGVDNVTVSLLTNSMRIEGNENPKEVAKAVKKAGYFASLKGETTKEPETTAEPETTEEPETTKEPETKKPARKSMFDKKTINGMGAPELKWVDWATDDKLSVRWTSLEGAAGYRVYRSKTRIGGYQTVTTLKGNSSLRAIVSSGKSERYYYVIRAYKVVNGKKKFGAVSNPIRNVKYKKSRLGELFPSGVPKSEKEMKKYLVAVKLPILNEKGKQSTITRYVHKALKDQVLACFEDMVKIGFPVRAVDTGSYCWRKMSTLHLMSHHSYGCVVDLNWRSNPMVSLAKIATSKYKPGKDPYSITQEVADIWKSHGFYWGGDWTEKKDFMHLTYTNN